MQVIDTLIHLCVTNELKVLYKDSALESLQSTFNSILEWGKHHLKVKTTIILTVGGNSKEWDIHGL